MKTKVLLSATAFLLSLFLILVSCGRKDPAIQKDVILKLSEISIPATATVQEGVVILEGVVETDDQKMQAEVEIIPLQGVKSVVNNIQVVPPAPKINPDEELAKKIMQSLYDAGYSLVKVNVTDSIATLSGEAKKKEMKRITDVVSQTGAKKIISTMTVK